MQKCIFVYSEKESLSRNERLKAILVWPRDDLGDAPMILPVGGSFERDEGIRKRLEELFSDQG